MVSSGNREYTERVRLEMFPCLDYGAILSIIRVAPSTCHWVISFNVACILCVSQLDRLASHPTFPFSFCIGEFFSMLVA